MKTRVIILVSILLLVAIPGVLTAQDSAAFYLTVTPTAVIPVNGDTAKLLYPGGTAALDAEIHMPKIPLYIYLSGGYGFNFMKYSEDTLMTIPLGGGFGIQHNFTPAFGFRARVGGGYGLNMILDGAEGGGFRTFNIDGEEKIFSGTGIVMGDVGIRFLIGKVFRLGIDGGYQYQFGGIGSVRAGINMGLAFGESGSSAEREPEEDATPEPEQVRPQPLKGTGIAISGVEFEKVFPVFYTYYDDHPVGRAVITNESEQELTDITVTLYIKQYMDGPKECAAPATLKAGESVTVDLNALFTREVFDITEGTKTAVEVSAAYSAGGKEYTETVSETISIENRNAMTWSDDRRAAAFVTAKDPSVLAFAKNISGLVSKNGIDAINNKLQIGMAMHEAVNQRGMTYVIDPATPYADLSAAESVVDFLQFPRETLTYKAGDCDDLSIMYCALFEAVSVETAFVTVPGHIFIAFSLDMEPDEARSTFSRPDEFIFREGKTWLPLEVTEIEGGFLKAWQIGAKEWRENQSRDQAGFFPIHDAWALYEPAGLPGSQVNIAMIDSEPVVQVFKKTLTTFVDREIYPQVAQIQADINRTQGKASYVNKLGVLYAKYGLYERAIGEFEKILEDREYVPALLNIGNIMFLQKNFEGALAYYDRAFESRPDSPLVLLSVARVHHELENYGTVKKYYDELKAKDPGIAVQFAYLDLKGEEASRAADIAQVGGMVLWDTPDEEDE